MPAIAIPDSHQLEHDFAAIITRQEIAGWPFDMNKALSLYYELDDRMRYIYQRVRPHLKHEIVRKYAPVANPFKKDGDPIARVKEYWGEKVHSVYGPYSPVEFAEPDLGSRQKLMKQLSRHGWKPVNTTEKGNPKLDEESLEGLDLGEVGNLLTEYYKARQRKSTLLGDRQKGWLTQAYEATPGHYRITARPIHAAPIHTDAPTVGW